MNYLSTDKVLRILTAIKRGLPAKAIAADENVCAWTVLKYKYKNGLHDSGSGYHDIYRAKR